MEKLTCRRDDSPPPGWLISVGRRLGGRLAADDFIPTDSGGPKSITANCKFIDLVVEMETVLFKLNNNDDGDYR